MLAASDLSLFILFAFPPRLFPPITSTLNNYSQLRNHTQSSAHFTRNFGTTKRHSERLWTSFCSFSQPATSEGISMFTVASIPLCTVLSLLLLLLLLSYCCCCIVIILVVELLFLLLSYCCCWVVVAVVVLWLFLLLLFFRCEPTITFIQTHSHTLTRSLLYTYTPPVDTRINIQGILREWSSAKHIYVQWLDRCTCMSQMMFYFLLFKSTRTRTHLN